MLAAQIDYLTNRLDCTDEHVKSTEEQLTMELDHRRNELVAFDLFMTGVATVRATPCALAPICCCASSTFSM